MASVTVTLYRAEFYSNPSGNEGKKFIGLKILSTDASGNASLAFSPARKVAAARGPRSRPLMYRESLAMTIHRHNPNFGVMIADPVSMDGEATRFAPPALVRDDHGVELNSPDGVVCWVGIMNDDHLKARISIDGKLPEIHEVSLDEVLIALDEAARFVSENSID